MREQVATIDVETRSTTDLRKCGGWKYAACPTTEVLCMAFRLPSWTEGRTGLWNPEYPHLGIKQSGLRDLDELFQWIIAGRPVEAHNCAFERAIYKHKLEPEGWPAIDDWQFRCSAAKAAAHTLPRGLEDVAIVLRLAQQKDKAGHQLMMKMSKPRKPRKAEREAWLKQHGTAPMPTLYHESAEMFQRLFTYCRQDVVTEAAVSDAVPDLLPSELELYLIDQEINSRGFQLDKEAVSTALELVSTETPKLNKELCLLTGGVVQKATQRAKMLAWFAGKGLHLDNSQKETIEDALTHTWLSMPVRRGLELVQMLGKASTAKYQSMQSWMGADGRVRGGLLFHGAGTGRWSGAGVQPHNFIRGIVKNMPALWEALKTHDRQRIQQVAVDLSDGKVRDVLAALSQALRGVIVAPPGRQLYVADYAAIEARCVLWLAGDEEALGIFRRHEDIYKAMAANVYHINIKDVNKDQRQMGKQAVLGLGYQMGWAKFQATCAKYGIDIDEDFAREVVTAYREKFWRVVRMWRDQEEAAMNAVIETGRRQLTGKTAWFTEGNYLYCELPSGRRLAYPEPEIRPWETSWGTEKTALTFTGISPFTRKWCRRAAYGGLIVENITQAVARDVMAEAMRRCDDSNIYDVVLSVHDEIIAEADMGAGSIKDFEQLVSKAPAWATNCPIEAEGFVCERYRK